MAEEEATPAQKLAIAKYFILSAPIGEVQEVLKDTKALVKDSHTLNDDNLKKLLVEYNTVNMTVATGPAGEEVFISTHGRVDDNNYLNPANGKIYKYDHLTQTVTGVTDQKQVLSAEIEANRHAVESAVKPYVDANYRPKKASFGVYGSDDGVVIVCIAGKNSRLSSYWTGGINAVYKINVKSGGSHELRAHIRAMVHYFEDGNVQLHSDFNKTVRVDVGHDATANARAIIAAIDKIETDYYSNLEDMYLNLHNQMFKAMRRFLPVSGQGMRWDSGVHGLAAEISQ